MVRSGEEIQDQQKTKNAGIVNQQCSGITCPKCGGPSRVKNGRPNKKLNRHGRYRQCDTCGTRFYTEEIISHIISMKEDK